jgi:hypothetical protein
MRSINANNKYNLIIQKYHTKTTIYKHKMLNKMIKYLNDQQLIIIINIYLLIF